MPDLRSFEWMQLRRRLASWCFALGRWVLGERPGSHPRFEATDDAIELAWGDVIAMLPTQHGQDGHDHQPIRIAAHQFQPEIDLADDVREPRAPMEREGA